MSGNPPPPDYDAIEQEMRRENALQVSALLAAGDAGLQKKVETFAHRFGYAVEQVRAKIAADPMFAAHFAKQPMRQGMHERKAKEWLRTLDSVLDFRGLPKSGANALYVTSDGEVKRGSDLQAKPSKSLDFLWRTGSTTCYAMHKFTRNSGGNQDSQFKEMRELLQQFLRCPDETCILLVIVDGLYYNEARMRELRRYTRAHAPRSYAVHIEDVPVVLADYATG